MSFPRPVEGGNSGDGSPLRLGDPGLFGDAFLVNGNPHLVDWNGDGRLDLVDSGGAVFAYGFEEPFADGTPVLDRGERWGEMSRSHQRDENDRAASTAATPRGVRSTESRSSSGSGTPT